MPDIAPDAPQRPSRKGKERDDREQDFAESFAGRMVALQRRAAANNKPRERNVAPPVQPPQPISRPDKSPKQSSAVRAPPTSPRKHHPSSNLMVQRPAEADAEDFSRRLKISSSPNTRPSPTPKHASSSKLFNPDTDPIPMRRTAEPESISDTASSSYVPRGALNGIAHRDVASRQLFDHRKDDPVRFSVLARPHGRPTPTPKSSGDYVSASSTSSYANSVVSSTFTLSSDTTGGSSASSALFEQKGKPGGEPGNNVFAIQLKKLYRTITSLEAKIKHDDADDNNEEGQRIMLQGKEMEDDEMEKEKWKKRIVDHKQLAEVIHNLLEISLAPSVPASLRNIPTKYNIIIRLWTYAFHKLLESLRRASFTSPLALEHLQDFIYYAYTFYTGLLEERILDPFKSGWLEALGDLARYRMIVATMVSGNFGNGIQLTAAAVSMALADSDSTASLKSDSDKRAARIDDSPNPSVGIAAARALDVEPEKERWRNIARDWYSAGLADTPGTGKLHHHLGLLSREVEGEELRAVYHFVKSMTTMHPFPTSRETVLPVWSASAQARRSLPDARVPDLFVLLHGMLFTNIQLDDFQPTLARFLERLEIEGAEEREWIMMAVINVGSVLEYGKPSGVLKRVGGAGARENGTTPAMRVIAKSKAAEEEKMDVDDEHTPGGGDEEHPRLPPSFTNQISPAASEAEGDSLSEFPVSFKLALQLTFAMLTHVLRHPMRKSSPFARSTLNPYLTVLLTFLATVLKHPQTLGVLERSIPWDALVQFFETVPRRVMQQQGLDQPANTNGAERWVMLTSGCAPPLPEDWCLRGMEWVGRKVFERGFWKSGEDRRPELETLDEREAEDLTDGRIEDDDEDGAEGQRDTSDMTRRWARIIRCGVGIATVVDGFTWVEGTRTWRVEGALAEKARRWREQEQLEREEEERRRARTRWADDSMDVDEEVVDEEVSDETDDENDTEEVRALKARRKYLQSLIQAAQRGSTASSPPRARPRRAKKPVNARPLLQIVAGYTVLVLDTNILLSSLSTIASLVESLRWTIVVPLPVIMELDGLASNVSPLGNAAKDAREYLTTHLRTHGLSLKVQTSKGNYLTTLNVRTEQVDFSQGDAERSMDDLILKAAIWQEEHWVDRSALLSAGAAAGDAVGAIKVVLLSLDRNLRLKARSRSLPAAGERDLAAILATGT